jgi:4-amino-4-deoxy-L-arabinose transferase-like glycosyltransferase
MIPSAGMKRRPLGFELALVVLVAAAVLVPGIWRYSLVDPWETHYGEVGRMMLQNHDLVHTEWPGTATGDRGDNEGFRSKPVLSFWLMAAGLSSVGVADGGGYSGEMVESARTMIGIRLPFVLAAIFGLTIMWWMLARLVSRRLAWLALLVVGSCPFFCLVSRQAIPDMPLVACTMGAIALFIMAVEDGDQPILPIGAIRIASRRLAFDARHIIVGLTGGFVAWQALYYAIYFTMSPQLAIRPLIHPVFWLPAMMILMLLGLWSRPWQWLRWAFAVDRWGAARSSVENHVLAMAPIRTMRPLYLLGCYSLLGIGVLAKGPPGLAVVGLVGLFHVLCFHKWGALWRGAFEIKRDLLMLLATALPWHLAMFAKDGIRFIDEYVFTHVLDRAAVGVDNSPATFEMYTSQIGHGMWLWAALLPAAVAAALLHARRDTREGRVRFTIVLWAIAGVATFSLVQTKFHHYILPAVPALALLVAFFLDDVLAKRDRLHPVFAALGVGIVLLITRDLLWEPKRWIEMFIYRYDRPWPSGDPWYVDPSGAFLGLGLAGAAALALVATRWARVGVVCVGAVGLAICVWSLQVYMPIAGTHWGMRDAVRTYYAQRTIYGEKRAYFGSGQLLADPIDETWSFDTFIPQSLQVGQPMTLTLELHKAEDERVVEQTLEVHGTVTKLGAHSVTVTDAPGEYAKLLALREGIERKHAALVSAVEQANDDHEQIFTMNVQRTQSGNAALPSTRDKAAAALRQFEQGGRPPVRAVDADRLLAWQLYWRGENFWSAEEIWGYLPEQQTSFPNTNNVEFTKYLSDRTRAPLGRRYFIVTETGKITTPRTMIPTQRGRDSYEVLDTTSNKFGLAAFTM